MSGFSVVGFFLISLLFGILIYSLWIRMALRYFNVSALNSLSQLIHSFTNPLVNPLHLLLRKKYPPGLRYDWMAFIVLVFVECLKIICLSLLLFHTLIPIYSLILFVFADLIVQPCNLLFYAVLIRVLMSYINPAWQQNPIAYFLNLLTDPLLIPARKIIPIIAGFDFSPLVVLLVLKIITIFITASLPGNLL